MKNLQSKDLPFRTLDQFYQPTTKAKTAEGIKVFPRNHDPNKQTIFSASPALPSIITYISGLNEAKHLPRRVHNRHQYFSVPKSCKRHQNRSTNAIIKELPENEDEKQRQFTNRWRIQTMVSNNGTNRSTAQILSHKTAQQRILNEEKNDFDLYKVEKKQEREKEMRFSFYNTIEKSEYFLNKFRQDNSLHERKTNKYQNMFRRNIDSSSIMALLDLSKEKLKYGY